MQRSISGRAWDVVAGFELGYATTAGDQIRVPLVDAWSLRLESVPPVRRFSSYRGQRHLSRPWWSATDGRHVGSESWLERDLMLLDFDPTVIAIGSQPFWLRWSEGSGRPVARRRHRDSAPCHADVVQPVGVAVIDSRERPAITGHRPAWRRQAARLRPEVMTPARLSSLRGMALQCSRTHDQDLLEAAGLVNARDVKNVPGRPKTDKLDAVWLAKLTEKGLLRPSFVPPAPIRQLRDYTRLRVDLTRERSRYWQRLEKLLEDALIKLSSVASTLNTLSARDMIEALIAGERDPRRLADLARGRMQTKRSALIKALDGRFDDHHAELARMLLDQIDTLSAQIGTLTARIDHLLAEDDPDDADGGGSVADQVAAASTRPGAVERLTEIPGIGQTGAQIILAEIGLDMTQFPTAGHLVSWAKLCPRTVQSGPVTRGGKTGKGNPYLKGALGEAAAAAAKTDTFLGERYRRIVKRRGKLKALVAVARSILVIVWHLLTDPFARFCDLGSDYHNNLINTERRIRNHIAQLTAMGYHVTLEPAA